MIKICNKNNWISRLCEFSDNSMDIRLASGPYLPILSAFAIKLYLFGYPGPRKTSAGLRQVRSIMPIRPDRPLSLYPGFAGLVASLLFLILSCGETREISGDVVFRNINIIDLASGEVLPARNVLLEGDRIAFIDYPEQGNSVTLKAAKSIDATGQYLIPGLWDMHAHPDDPEVWRLQPAEDARNTLLPLFVVNGVTGIRDMGGDIDLVKRWRAAYVQGDLLAPVIYAGGPLLDGPNPMWDGSVGISGPEGVKPVVDSLIALGVDFLKVYSLLPRDTYMDLSAYANEIGFPFAGHVPYTVLPSEAARTGMKSQEHLLEILRECSDPPPKALLDSLDALADPIGRSNGLNTFRLSNYNEGRADSLFTLFRELGTWHCPTLSMWKKNAWYESELEKDRLLLAYLPPYLQAYWTPEVNDHLQHRDRADYIQTKQHLYQRYLHMVGRMQELGVPLLAGTDMGANPLCHPGEGVHNELEALVEAGLTPLEALRTATLNPARFLEIEADYGSVEAGKKADLVILEGNPLESIGQTRNIAYVIRGGQLLDATRLEAIRREIRERNQNEP